MIAEFESEVLKAIQQKLDKDDDVFTDVVTTTTIEESNKHQIITVAVSRKKG